MTLKTLDSFGFSDLGFIKIDVEGFETAVVNGADEVLRRPEFLGLVIEFNGAGGGVGVVAVQLAAARGLRVIGTASPAKHDLIARLGGFPVAYGEGVTERVRALGTVDAVFDLVGGGALRKVAELCPPAKLRSVADKPLVKELGGDEVVRDRSTAVLDALAALVAQGKLDPLVSEVLPFAEAPAAMRAVESGHTQGKIVLRLP